MNRYQRPEWRTQSRTKRKFYAGYLKWIERIGYLVVVVVFIGFIFAFTKQEPDVVKADGARVEATAVAEMSAPDESVIVKLLVDNFSEVKAGDPVLEVAVGKTNVYKFRDYVLATEALKAGAINNDPTDPPPTLTLRAPADGVFQSNEVNTSFAKGDSMARILDYSKLVVRAEVEGATVAKAKPGQTARITAINFGDQGIVFRASSNVGQIISGRILAGKVKDEVAKLLAGKTVRARDDLALTIEGVKTIQIDTNAAAAATQEPLVSVGVDPSMDDMVSGIVESGVHVGILQTSQLPQDVRAALERQTRAALAATGFEMAKGRVVLKDLREFNVVVQLTVKGEAAASGFDIPATVINRKFQAVVVIPNPPRNLVAAVRQADMNGTAVTGRVEVVTGTRPLALILLKK